MSDPQDMEALATQEHESWAKWTRWMLGEIEKEILSFEPSTRDDLLAAFQHMGCVQRWRRQMVTHYADLSEKDKESDRKVVREKLPLYRPNNASMRGGVSRRG